MSTDKKDTAPETENEKVEKELRDEVKAEEAVPEAKKSDAAAADAKKAEAGTSEGKSEGKKKCSKKKDSKKADEKAGAKSDGSAEKEKSSADELAALNDKYLRLCAEYDNFRRRSQKEKTEIYSDVKANAVKEFLPVYDNLERAIAQETEDEAYAKGVEMIMAQFKKTLEKLGVNPIEDVGHTFDPNLHNAVMHVDDEEKGENEIVDVFQKGFTLGDKVIRFSMVKVAN